jgi:ABC-2 type transport system ATP-binding protein
MHAVIAKNLVKEYKETQAVKGISFAVEEGEIFALIGPNGAGKSTTLRMLATLIEPTSGTADICGLDIKKDPAKVREIISYLPEEAGAYKNLTGIGYLEFMSGLYSDDSRKRNEYVELAREISGLGARLKDKVKTYSKGMSRKLLLARTVMVRPKLAILDEPTSGLDIINAMEIRQTVRNLSKQGMSVLLSSHNMLEIEFLSDRLAIIHQGEIRETGTAQELKAKHSAANLEEVFMSATKLQ